MQILKPFDITYSEELRLTAAQAYDLPLDYDDTGCSVFKKVCKIKNISI